MRERIIKIIKTFNLTQKEFAKNIGITSAGLNDYLKGRANDISSNKIKNIILKYNINPIWLLTGEGKMFLPGKREEPQATGNDNGFSVVDGTVSEHPELDILPKIAHTGWWKSLTETEREIIMLMAGLKDSETKKKVCDLLDACRKKEIAEDELQKRIDER